MKLTNGDIFMAREPLGKLIENKFPVKVSYDLAMMTNKLNEQLKVIDEVRNGLISTYGTPDKDNPQQIAVPQDSEGFPKFAEEFAELMNTEAEIDFGKVKVPVKLPEKVAGTCDKCNHNMDKALEIEVSIMMALEKFIEVA